MNVGGGQWFLLSGVSSASCDGTPITTQSGQCYFPMSTQDGNDHTITFTVQSGNLPTLSSNYFDAGKYITKAIFNQ